jgi:hypothetical protein
VATRRSLGGVQFEAVEHESPQRRPVVKGEIAQQRFQVLKERTARSEGGPNGAVLVVHQIKHGVKQKGEQVQGEQRGSQKLLAMAEIVLQVIAFGLEHMVFSFSTFQRVRPSRTKASTVVSVMAKSVIQALW